jgi:hypothetical protein
VRPSLPPLPLLRQRESCAIVSRRAGLQLEPVEEQGGPAVMSSSGVGGGGSASKGGREALGRVGRAWMPSLRHPPDFVGFGLI